MTERDFTPEQLNILEQCLSALSAGQMSISDCLAQYPQHATWLKPELTVAHLATRLNAPAMPASNVDALEARLMKRFDTKQQREKPANNIIRFPGFFAGKAAAVLVLVLLMGLAGTGTVAASAQSKPDDVLYSVKRAWEDIIVLLATLFGQVDDVWLHLAKERADDVMYLDDKDTLTLDALMDLQRALENAILLSDADTGVALVSFMESTGNMLAQKSPTITLQTSYDRVQHLLTPRYDENGRLTLINTAEPVIETPVAATATMIATATQTVTDLPTETPLPAATATDTQMPTRTPRFAATATRTPVAPTALPSATATEIRISPTATWTALPLPDGFVTGTPPPDSPSGNNSGNRASATPGTDGQPLFLRETERAVFMTQTAIADDNFGTPGASE